jgi:hypothetical protein
MRKTPLGVALMLAILVTSASALAGTEVTFDSLPAAVRSTALREIKTGRVVEVERETSKEGQVVYEIDFIDAGVEWELDIAADGTLLRRSED